MQKKRDNNSTKPARIRSKQRQAQALELRKAGATYQAIADQLGYASARSCAESVRSALRTAIHEPAEELRGMEIERLDNMMLVLWPRVMQGDLACMDRALRIQLRIAELAGYDRVQATVEHQNVVIIGGSTEEYVAQLQQLRTDAMNVKPHTAIPVASVIDDRDVIDL